MVELDTVDIKNPHVLYLYPQQLEDLRNDPWAAEYLGDILKSDNKPKEPLDDSKS